MIDRTEKVSMPAGTMDVFVTHPEGSGPFPVLVQIMDARGMREELQGLARRAASLGYYVLAPDLFYHKGVKGPLTFSPDTMKMIMGLIADLTAERVTGDVTAALKLAENDKAARKGKIGIYGFCMGGFHMLVLAQALGEKVAAGAALHPGRLVNDEPSSPHRHLDRVKAELYFGIADKDTMATPAQMEELEQALKARGIKYQLEFHPGALHGFMGPEGEVYNKEAAEKAWRRMEALFARAFK